jgi:hypothetical protein
MIAVMWVTPVPLATPLTLTMCDELSLTRTSYLSAVPYWVHVTVSELVVLELYVTLRGTSGTAFTQTNHNLSFTTPVTEVI